MERRNRNKPKNIPNAYMSNTEHVFSRNTLFSSQMDDVKSSSSPGNDKKAKIVNSNSLSARKEAPDVQLQIARTSTRNYSPNSFYNKHNLSKPAKLSSAFLTKSNENGVEDNYLFRKNEKDEILKPFPQPIVYQSGKDSQINMKGKFISSVNQYKNSKASFYNIYRRWLSERRITVNKLHSLLKEVHENAVIYNETQATFKEFSYNSRSLKRETEDKAINFFASLAAFVSDAANGISSFAQAVNVDSCQTKFQEIMDHDAEITKELYISRSQCFVEYQGIEEVMRKFHSATLTTTADKISNTLQVDKHWAAMKNAYEKNDMPKLLDAVCNFFDNACQAEVLNNVSDSINTYASDNPAALECCKSTGKAAYGAINTFRQKKDDRNAAIEYLTSATDLYLMLEDKQEVNRLRRVMKDDTNQSKLESQIQEAIDLLESEMKEMSGIYFRLFNDYDSD